MREFALLTILILMMTSLPAFEKGKRTQINKLMSLLDLSQKALKEVKNAFDAGDEKLAQQKLLQYYQQRQSPLSHPISKPTEKDYEIAKNGINHIFISQTSYPPTQYNKGKIDWEKSPYPDNQWNTQLHRFRWWGPMAEVYQETKDETYAKAWISQFLDWKENIPIDHDIYWNQLNIGIRAYGYANWFMAFKPSKSLEESFLAEYLTNIYDHATRLEAKVTTKNNWGLMESEGLAHIAIIFPEFKEASKWRDLALKRLQDMNKTQILADGMHSETCFGYHIGSIAWFSRTAQLAKLNNIAIDPAYELAIKKMYEVLAYCAKPNLHTPSFGDSWDNSAKNTIEKGAEIFANEELRYISQLDLSQPEGTEPKQKNYIFEPSGYYVLRSAWQQNALWLMLKCGINGGWHADPDNGTFELFAFGQDLMPDTGCFTYNNGKDRNRQKATRRHQCMTSEFKNIQMKAKHLLWVDQENISGLSVENQSYSHLKHRRNLFLIQNEFFLIIDEAIGDAKDIRLHFQFGEGSLEENELGLQFQHQSKQANLAFVIKDKNLFHFQKDSFDYSPKYRQRLKRPIIDISLNKEKTFVGFLIPFQKAQKVQITNITLLGQEKKPFQAGDTWMEIGFQKNQSQYYIIRDLKEKKVQLIQK